MLHAHFHAAADGEATVFGPTGRLEEGQRLVLLDQVKAWCGDSRTKITIRPVIDLNAHLTAPAYAIPDRLREQVILRDRTCVFPWCTRPARRCQVDHVIAYDHTADAEGRPQPGPTRPRTSRVCARSTTDSRPTAPGATSSSAPAATSGPVRTGTATVRDPDGGTTALDPPPPVHPKTPAKMTPPHTP